MGTNDKDLKGLDVPLAIAELSKAVDFLTEVSTTLAERLDESVCSSLVTEETVGLSKDDDYGGSQMSIQIRKIARAVGEANETLLSLVERLQV
jgi:hypothetical protein